MGRETGAEAVRDAELESLRRERHEAEQILAVSLGYYPWYKDDPKKFPNATEADGVCTGPFTLLDIAREAADKIGDEKTMTLRETILAKLKTLDWTQADLARATNIPKQNLGPILNGKRPLLANHVFVIDNVLNLGLDYGDCEWPVSPDVDHPGS